jgi:hypothetical protein
VNAQHHEQHDQQFNAQQRSESLQAMPLPNAILKPAVRVIGEVILDTTLETVAATLDSPEGEKAVLDAAGAVLDDIFYGPGLVEMEILVKEITLQILENMMDIVKVKKWALPDDQQGRPPMPWEPGALDAPDLEGEIETAAASEPKE